MALAISNQACYNQAMADFFTLLELLFKLLNEPWIVVLVVLFCYFLLKKDSAQMQKDNGQMQKDIGQIKEDLRNHITETNNKIDKLSDRIDRLYEWLLRDKGGNKSKDKKKSPR